jgi:hypothetical protein
MHYSCLEIRSDSWDIYARILFEEVAMASLTGRVPSRSLKGILFVTAALKRARWTAG